MKVHELIKVLAGFPKNADVYCAWDGGARSSIEQAWMSRRGIVLIADNDEVIYNNEDRPVGAPSEEEEEYWQCTPKKLKKLSEQEKPK